MQMKSSISKDATLMPFSDDLDTELSRLNSELRLYNILNLLANDEPLADSDRENIRHMLLVLNDLFSTSLPPVEDNPFDMLLLAARDEHLSRLLKERGLARIFRLLTLNVEVLDELTNQTISVPAFMLEPNPDTGTKFKNQEEFLGWWCKSARVPRSLVFMRMATYSRLLSLGMNLDEAFEVILKKPYAAREVMNEVATWQRGELVDIKPDVAVRLARSMTPESASIVEELATSFHNAESVDEAEQIMGELRELSKPAIRKMVEEVANHESMRDAMDMVRHDIADKPEIRYWYDAEHRWIVVEYIRKEKDVRGNNYISEIVKIPLIPEVDMPAEVMEDMAKRLSFKNRDVSFI